jgi:hypothetical protein
MKRRELLKGFVICCLLALLVMLMVKGCADAMMREDEARDLVRLDRCARFGETLPAEWRAYCEGQ